MVQTDSPSEAKGEGGRSALSSGTPAAAVVAVRLAQTGLSVPGGVGETDVARQGR